MTLGSLRLFWLGVAPLTLAACTGRGPALFGVRSWF
jgi:hypothetical protein